VLPGSRNARSTCEFPELDRSMDIAVLRILQIRIPRKSYGPRCMELVSGYRRGDE